MNSKRNLLTIAAILFSCLITFVAAQDIQSKHNDKGYNSKPHHSDRDYNNRHRPCGYNEPMSKEKFDFLLNKIKKKPFKDDKLDLIEVATLNGYFTSMQCRNIMKLFSFDDDKMQVLDKMKDNITDKENCLLIVDAFTFESQKQKVRNVLRCYDR